MTESGADDLDDRADRLEEHEVRQRDQSDDPVAGAQQHRTMAPERLDQTPVPAVALAAERAEVRRRLGPADRVGEKDDAIGRPCSRQ